MGASTGYLDSGKSVALSMGQHERGNDAVVERYCTNCGGKLGPNDAFCAGCGKPTHETAAVATPEVDVDMPPPTQRFWTEETPPARRGLGRVVKVTRLDKIVGLILAMVIGVPLLLAVAWVVLQFILGFLSGFFGAL